MNSYNLIDDILSEESVKVEKNIDLSTLTNTQTGGLCHYMIYPETVGQLITIVKRFNTEEIQFIVVGGLTNVVFSSITLSAVVINMSDFGNNMTLSEENGQPVLNVDAKFHTKEVARYLLNKGVTGFQWAEGIPGTIGGAVYMNASAYGPGIDSLLIDAKVLTPDLEIKTLANKDFDFRYRKSSIQEQGFIILSARFLLRYGKKWKIALRMMQFHNQRAKSQPLNLPSAGTVFVPPKPYHVGSIIPKMNMQNLCVGGMKVSDKNFGFIVNVGSGTGEDYRNLVEVIENSVKKKYGIDLEREVRFFGFSENE